MEGARGPVVAIVLLILRAASCGCLIGEGDQLAISNVSTAPRAPLLISSSSRRALCGWRIRWRWC